MPNYVHTSPAGAANLGMHQRLLNVYEDASGYLLDVFEIAIHIMVHSIKMCPQLLEVQGSQGAYC